MEKKYNMGWHYFAPSPWVAMKVPLTYTVCLAQCGLRFFKRSKTKIEINWVLIRTLTVTHKVTGVRLRERELKTIDRLLAISFQLRKVNLKGKHIKVENWEQNPNFILSIRSISVLTVDANVKPRGTLTQHNCPYLLLSAIARGPTSSINWPQAYLTLLFSPLRGH